MDDDLESDTTLVAVDRSAHGWFGDDELVDAVARFEQELAVAGRTDEPAHLFADRAYDVDGWDGTPALGPELFEHRQDHGEGGLGVD